MSLLGEGIDAIDPVDREGAQRVIDAAKERKARQAREAQTTRHKSNKLTPGQHAVLNRLHDKQDNIGTVVAIVGGVLVSTLIVAKVVK